MVKDTDKRKRSNKVRLAKVVRQITNDLTERNFLSSKEQERKREEVDRCQRFLARAVEAGFTEREAKFLYENLSLPGHEHFTLGRIGGY